MQLKPRAASNLRIHMKGGGGYFIEKPFVEKILSDHECTIAKGSLLQCESWDTYPAKKLDNNEYSFERPYRRDRNRYVEGALVVEQLSNHYIVGLWQNRLFVVHQGSASILDEKTNKYVRIVDWLSTQKDKR